MEDHKKCLVTSDLISSVEWLQKAPSTKIQGQDITWQQKAYTDLKNKLARIYTDMPIAAQQGIDFEKRLYNIASFRPDIESLKCSMYFKQVLYRIKGFEFQKKQGTEFLIYGYSCYLYGKFDCYSDKKIIDIKTTSNYKDDKYKKSFQHKLYITITDVRRFEYLVIEWLDYPKIKDVHSIIIEHNPEDIRNEVERRIINVFEFLKDIDLWELYRTKYCLY